MIIARPAKGKIIQAVIESDVKKMKFKDKAVIVTGAGRGIGEEMALAFAREGADIAVNDLSLDRLEEVLGRITNDCKRRAVPLVGNVGSAEDVNNMVATALNELGKVDILINNAGTGQEVVPIVDQSVERWDRVVGTHLRGTFLFSQSVGRFMVKQRQGVIINIASIAGFGGFPMRTSLRSRQARHHEHHAGAGYRLGCLRHPRQRHRPGVIRRRPWS